jgi:hypothetical protein
VKADVLRLASSSTRIRAGAVCLIVAVSVGAGTRRDVVVECR